jgi:hypothetical protein
MSEVLVSDADLLQLEDDQLYIFLTEIRALGEEKSDLYPEPQYFNAVLMGMAANYKYVLDKVAKRCGGADRYGAGARRVLSPATGLQFSVIGTIITHGREMLLLEDGVPGQRPGVVYDDGDLSLTDRDTAEILRFGYDTIRHYRQDGRVYPSDTKALGDNYRILSPADAGAIAANTTQIDQRGAQEVLRLMAAIRALSFLMEAETREGLMVHGPYSLEEPNHQLIIFECNDLRWPLFTNFPLSAGARWLLPDKPFPTANLAIALVLKDVSIQADRHGTLYIEPLSAMNVVSASLLTRGGSPYRDEGLSKIPVTEASALRRSCDEIQEYMFLQVAGWDVRQRMEAGVFQEQLVMLRILAAAGFDQRELEQEQLVLFERCARVYGPYFEAILARRSDQIPFFVKLNDFMARRIPRIFTPLVLSN